MNMVSLPVAMMSAVCFYVGSYYLWMYIRRRSDWTNFLFALTCFAIALYDVFSAGLYSATSISQGMFWQRLQFASLCLFSITVSWFIYHFTGYPSRRPFIVVSVWMSLLFVLGLSVRGEMTLSLLSPRIKNINIADFINITYYEVDPGIVYTIQYVSMAVLTCFILFIIVRYVMSGERRYAVPLVACMGLFSAAALNDILVGAGLYRFIFLMEYAYMLIILFMARVLLNQFLDLHREVTELNVRLGAGSRGVKPGPSMSPVTEEKIRRAISYINDNYTADISREGLAASLDMHPDSLGRYFKMFSGRKINDYINELRIRDAAGRIRESDDTIISVAFQVGFESLATFNRAFSRVMGESPGQYRELSRKRE